MRVSLARTPSTRHPSRRDVPPSHRVLLSVFLRAPAGRRVYASADRLARSARTDPGTPAGGRGFCLPDMRRNRSMTILAAAAAAATLTPDELGARLGNPTLTILDVRPIAAYNGWRLGDEARGGHVPGAASFPAAWLGSVDAPEVARLLAEKGAVAGRDIVVYGDGGADARPLAAHLRERGLTDVATLTGGFGAWA